MDTAMSSVFENIVLIPSDDQTIVYVAFRRVTLIACLNYRLMLSFSFEVFQFSYVCEVNREFKAQ